MSGCGKGTIVTGRGSEMEGFDNFGGFIHGFFYSCMAYCMVYERLGKPATGRTKVIILASWYAVLAVITVLMSIVAEAPVPILGLTAGYLLLPAIGQGVRMHRKVNRPTQPQQ